MITATGLGSGLDIDSIVSQLVELEQRPLLKLQTQKAEIQAEISGYGQFKNAISSLKKAAEKLSDGTAFSVFNAHTSDEQVFTATASDGAALSNHKIVVDSALAQRQRLASEKFANEDETVGSGTLQFSVGEESFELTLDSTNNSLAGIRDAINGAGDNTGVTASVINVEGGSRLILTSQEAGTANAIEVSVTGDGDGNDGDTNGLSNLVYQSAGTKNLTEKNEAKDVTLQVDGFDVTSSSNVLTDVIAGVTINLVGKGSGDLSLSRDTTAATEAVQEFVDAYNGLIAQSSALQDSGALSRVSMVSNIQNRLRSVFSTNADGMEGAIALPFQVGLEFDLEGGLNFDDSTFEAALQSDAHAVMDFFSDESQGLVARIDQVLGGYSDTGGFIDSRTETLNTRTRDLDRRVENFEFRLEKIEERLRAQFTALDGLIAGLQTTSTYLEQQLDNLPGAVLRSNR